MFEESYAWEHYSNSYRHDELLDYKVEKGYEVYQVSFLLLWDFLISDGVSWYKSGNYHDMYQNREADYNEDTDV